MHTADLFLVDELDDVGRTSALAEGQLTALRAVADWIQSFVVKPHEDIGRAGLSVRTYRQPWNAGSSGSLRSRSETATCRTSWNS
jgi:hypothetical protein